MNSMLRAVVLEVSMAQIPRLRLLSTHPQCHADSNPYLQGHQLLPSLREDLAFLVLPERQRKSAQGDQVRSHAHLSWKAGQDPLGMRKIYRAIPYRFQSSSGHGSGPALVLGVFLGSSGCATLDLGLDFASAHKFSRQSWCGTLGLEEQEDPARKFPGVGWGIAQLCG